MGMTRQQAERCGLGHLFPKQGVRKPAHQLGVMNRTEQRYSENLEARRLAGEILGWSFESDTLVLCETAVYKPDFTVLAIDRETEYHEIKQGYARKDASAAGIVKIKWAAQRYAGNRFFLCRLRNGQWIIKRVIAS